MFVFLVVPCVQLVGAFVAPEVVAGIEIEMVGVVTVVVASTALIALELAFVILIDSVGLVAVVELVMMLY